MNAPTNGDGLWRHGRDLYAAGEHWRAHEAWEALWLPMAESAERTFLRAVIQAAAAMVKAEQGNMAGVRKNLTKAIANLAGAPARCRGVDTRALAAACERCARYAARSPARSEQANRVPFDWRFKPPLPAGEPAAAQPAAAVHSEPTSPQPGENHSMTKRRR